MDIFFVSVNFLITIELNRDVKEEISLFVEILETQVRGKLWSRRGHSLGRRGSMEAPLLLSERIRTGSQWEAEETALTWGSGGCDWGRVEGCVKGVTDERIGYSEISEDFMGLMISSC